MSEVQELPQGWVSTTISEICSRPQYGWTTKAERQNGRVKLLRTTDISSGSINWDKVPYCTDIPENLEDYKLYPGDIVISRAGSVGISHLLKSVPSEAVFASYLIRFQPSKDIDSRFMAYYLQAPSYWSAIHEQSSGIALANVNARKLEALYFPLAPLPEQQRIVEALEQQLSRLDAGVVALRSTQQKLKRYRASVLKAAVEGKLTGEWRKSHPEVEPAPELLKRILQERRAKWEEEQIAKGRDPQKVKYEEPVGPDVKGLPKLPELPAGWCWTLLEMVADAIDPQPSHRTPPTVTDGIPYLGIGDVGKNGVLNMAQARKVAKRVLEEHKERYHLKEGDFIFGKIGTLGKPVKLHPPFEYALSANVVLVQPKSLASEASFIFTYTASPLVERLLIEGGKATTQAAFGIQKVRILPLPLPPLAEQEQIVSLVEERLSIISTLESTIEQVLKRAERMRQSILHRAFTGKLVAQDPNDEPASMLLERIRREREEAAAPQKLKHLVYKENGKSSRKRVAELAQPYLLLDAPDPEPVDSDTIQGELWNATS